MIKLYRNKNNIFEYWETWENGNNSATIHWGIVGHPGSTKEIKSSLFKSHKKVVQLEINEKIKEGFKEIDIDDHYTLLIEYKIDSMGLASDIEKRHELEDLMNETLGWNGLGHCDGGSIGSGTMEVCCFVVDFAIAKDLIIKKLENTKFSDFSRIFDENQD